MGGILSDGAKTQEAFKAVRKIFAIIDDNSVMHQEFGKVEREIEGEIEFENIWFQYPTRQEWILKDFNLKIQNK